MKLEEISDAADQLTEQEQGELVSQLLRKLEGRTYHVSDQEVTDRVEEGSKDETNLISLDTFVAGLRRHGN